MRCWLGPARPRVFKARPPPRCPKDVLRHKHCQKRLHFPQQIEVSAQAGACSCRRLGPLGFGFQDPACARPVSNQARFLFHPKHPPLVASPARLLPRAFMAPSFLRVGSLWHLPDGQGSLQERERPGKGVKRTRHSARLFQRCWTSRPRPRDTRRARGKEPGQGAQRPALEQCGARGVCPQAAPPRALRPSRRQGRCGRRGTSARGSGFAAGRVCGADAAATALSDTSEPTPLPAHGPCGPPGCSAQRGVQRPAPRSGGPRAAVNSPVGRAALSLGPGGGRQGTCPSEPPLPPPPPSAQSTSLPGCPRGGPPHRSPARLPEPDQRPARLALTTCSLPHSSPPSRALQSWGSHWQTSVLAFKASIPMR